MTSLRMPPLPIWIFCIHIVTLTSFCFLVSWVCALKPFCELCFETRFGFGFVALYSLLKKHIPFDIIQEPRIKSTFSTPQFMPQVLRIIVGPCSLNSRLRWRSEVIASHSPPPRHLLHNTSEEILTLQYREEWPTCSSAPPLGTSLVAVN